MKNRLILLALVFLASAAQAKTFEGTVRYRILGSEQGHEMTVSVRKDKLRVDMEGSGGQGGSMIMDMTFKNSVMILPEKKLYMKLPFEEPKAKQPKDAFGRLKKTGHAEAIAGYMAEEWAYTGEEAKTSFWASQDLGGWAFMQMQGAEGLALPRELRDGSFMLMRVKDEKGRGLEAVAVDPKQLPDSLFVVPADYKEAKGLAPSPAKGSKKKGKPAREMTREEREQLEKSMEHMTPEQRAMIEGFLKAQREKQ